MRVDEEAPAAPAADPRKWWVLVAVGTGTFMSALDGSVVNAILPVLRDELRTDVATVEWVVTVYLLVVSGLLLGFGRLGDVRGHKGVYLWGLSGFVASSALWACATTAASNGSVNSMHDSYTPLGGLVPMWLMQLGEVVCMPTVHDTSLLDVVHETKRALWQHSRHGELAARYGGVLSTSKEGSRS